MCSSVWLAENRVLGRVLEGQADAVVAGVVELHAGGVRGDRLGVCAAAAVADVEHGVAGEVAFVETLADAAGVAAQGLGTEAALGRGGGREGGRGVNRGLGGLVCGGARHTTWQNAETGWAVVARGVTLGKALRSRGQAEREGLLFCKKEAKYSCHFGLR